MCVRLQSLVWGGLKFRIVFAGSISFKQRDYTLSKSCAKFVVKGTQAVQRKKSELNKIMQLLFHRAVMWNNTSYMLIKHMALLGIKHGLLLLLFYEIKKKRLLDFERNLNASKGCNSLWLQQKKGEGKKSFANVKTEISRTCFFSLFLFFSPLCNPFPSPASLCWKPLQKYNF